MSEGNVGVFLKESVPEETMAGWLYCICPVPWACVEWKLVVAWNFDCPELEAGKRN